MNISLISKEYSSKKKNGIIKKIIIQIRFLIFFLAYKRWQYNER